MTLSSPRRGEVWFVNFSPSRGREHRGTRPALVIQNDVGNQFAGTTIVAAIASTIKIYPVTVLLKKGETGLRQPSMVKLAQILTVDRSRLQRRAGILPPEVMHKVDSAIRVSLQLSQ